MDKDKIILIENVLFNAISAFHDCDNKNLREHYIKKFTQDFCKEHNLNPIEVIEVLKKIIEEQRKSGFGKYKYYTGNNLDKIILENTTNDSSEISIEEK